MSEKIEDSTLESTTITINRTAKTVKGGRNMSFGALVVVGDRNGRVGVGYGKGRGVPAAIEKAQKSARKNLFSVPRNEGTIPHRILGKFCGSSVLLIPATPGTGVIAGGTVRAILEMAGIHDCRSKVHGSTNKANLSKAVVTGLKGLTTREQVEALRGLDLGDTDVERMLKNSAKIREARASEGEVVEAASLSELNAKAGIASKKAEEVKEEVKEDAAPEAADNVEAAAETEAPAEAEAEATAEAAAEETTES